MVSSSSYRNMILHKVTCKFASKYTLKISSLCFFGHISKVGYILQCNTWSEIEFIRFLLNFVKNTHFLNVIRYSNFTFSLLLKNPYRNSPKGILHHTKNWAKKLLLDVFFGTKLLIWRRTLGGGRYSLTPPLDKGDFDVNKGGY